MNFGPTTSYLKTQSAGSTIEISGSGFETAIALGGSVSRHLVIYGEICEGAIFSGPTMKVNGQSRGGGDDVIFVSIGPGVAYFFGETNIFLSASLSLARMTFEGFDLAGISDQSLRGVSLRALLGKEWWVSDDWGIGAALTLTLSSIGDKDLETNTTIKWNTSIISLLFSTTFN